MEKFQIEGQSCTFCGKKLYIFVDKLYILVEQLYFLVEFFFLFVWRKFESNILPVEKNDKFEVYGGHVHVHN